MFFHRYLQKRIVLLLIPYSRFRAVPRVYLHIIGQRQQPLFNRFHQRVMIAFRQVCPADSLMKKRIPAKNNVITF